MKRLMICLTILVAFSPSAGLSELRAGEPIEIGSRRELFTDTKLIERINGQLELRLHHPTPCEIVMKHDEPWEGNNTTYHCMFKDGDRYRMFYVGRHSTLTKKGQLNIGLSSFCYAESDDGIHWRKPNLGQCEFQGSKSNNIMMDPATAARHNVCLGAPAVFRDDNPQATPDARYKTFMASEARWAWCP